MGRAFVRDNLGGRLKEGKGDDGEPGSLYCQVKKKG